MDWAEKLDDLLQKYIPQMKVIAEEPMSRHTTFRIGGPAKRMAFPSDGAQMVLLVNFAMECGTKPLIIGNGSNLLVPDEGLDRLVIDTSAYMNKVSWETNQTPLRRRQAQHWQKPQILPQGRAVRLGIRTWHSGNCRRRRMHERRRLWWRNEAGVDLCADFVPGGRRQDADERGTEARLSAQHSVRMPGGRCAVRDHAAVSGQGKNDSGYHAGTDA